MLTRRQWFLLDALSDQDEPLESLYNAYTDGDRTIDPHRMMDDIFQLFQQGLITIRQEPVSVFQNDFERKAIIPNSASDIIGDLKNEFISFCSKRDYLWHITLGEGSNATAGVPFGIWIDMTEAGRREWRNSKYKSFYPDQIE